jgi:hypothetical protein
MGMLVIFVVVLHLQSVDASIHIGYINLIRNAQRYLYLENQYFLGSAHLWERLVSSTAALAWKGCICDAVDGNNDCLGIKPAADMLISLA